MLQSTLMKRTLKYLNVENETIFRTSTYLHLLTFSLVFFLRLLLEGAHVFCTDLGVRREPQALNLVS